MMSGLLWSKMLNNLQLQGDTQVAPNEQLVIQQVSVGNYEVPPPETFNFKL